MRPSVQAVLKELRRNRFFSSYAALGERLGTTRQWAEEAVSELVKDDVIRIINRPKNEVVFLDNPQG